MRTRFLVCLLALAAALLPLAAIAQDSGSNANDEFVLRIDGSELVTTDKRVGVAIVIDGNLDIEGRVEEFILVIDGDIAVLNGAVVNADIVLVDGTITLRDGSVVNGDIRVSDQSTLITEEGSQFNGSFRDDWVDRDITASAIGSTLLSYFVIWGAATVMLLVAAVVFAGVGGRQLVSSARYMTERPGGTIAGALIYWVALPGAIGLLFVTILGTPLALLVSLAGAVIWMLGYIVAGTRIGMLALGRRVADEPGVHPYLTATIGVLILQIVILVLGAALVMLGLIALAEGGTGWFGPLFGIPALLLAAVIWAFGTLGAGALIYRAFRAWTRPPYGQQRPPSNEPELTGRVLD